MFVESVRLGSKEGIAGQFALDAKGDASTRLHDTEQFPQCGRPVRKELQRLLAKGEIEPIIGEQQVVRARLDPLRVDAGILRAVAGDLQHVPVEIGSGQASGGKGGLRELTGNDPGTAGKIENMLPVLRLCPADELPCPRLEYDGYQDRLIAFREISGIARCGLWIHGHLPGSFPNVSMEGGGPPSILVERLLSGCGNR